MARGDEFLFEVARRALLLELARPRGDRLPPARSSPTVSSNPAVVRELYALAGEAMQAESERLGIVLPRLAADDPVSVRGRRWSCSSAS